MKINISEKKEAVILHLEGSIDINASDFIEAVGWVLVNKSKNILCDFSGVNAVDYVGISVIAVAYKNVLNHQGKMKIYSLTEDVLKVFCVVGLDKVLEYYDDESQALAGIKEDEAISDILKKRLRRRFKRVSLESAIEYKLKTSSDDCFYRGTVINISAIGVFMVAEKVFSCGQVLSVKLFLMPSPGVVEMDAKVIWASEDYLQPLEFPGMGLEFCDTDCSKQKLIIDFVEKNIAGSGIED